MSVTTITGGNWGDEGKGKMTDLLAEKSDFVVRYQGGDNAGHTIINHYGKFVLHILPSGVFYSGVTNIIGNGVALNIESFLSELEMIESRGVESPTIYISDRVQVVMPYHILFDKLEESRLGDRKFGSTKRGMAPFFSDKFSKLGIKITDLFNKELLVERVSRGLELKYPLLEELYNNTKIDLEDIIDRFYRYGKMIKPYVRDCSSIVNEGLKNGRKVLLEGQLGALRDPDFGIYPFTTSSSTLSGYGAVGVGIPPRMVTESLVVVKSYSSCVGEGPFVSELKGSLGDKLRELGGDCGEYGATTRRARRVGWFDLVATKYGVELQHGTTIALTNLDVLSHFEEIKICVGYELDGKLLDRFPSTDQLWRVKGIYKSFKGWSTDIGRIRRYDDLPDECKIYITFIEKGLGVTIRYISNGPKRGDIIIK